MREECGHCGFVPKLINVYNKTGNKLPNQDESATIRKHIQIG